MFNFSLLKVAAVFLCVGIAVLVYLVFTLRKDVRKYNATMEEQHDPSSTSNHIEDTPGEKEEKKTSQVNDHSQNETKQSEKNPFHDLIDKVLKDTPPIRHVYSSVQQNPWDKSVYAVENNWVNRTATHTLNDLATNPTISHFKIVAVVRMAKTTSDGKLQFIVQDPTSDKYVMPAVKLNKKSDNKVAFIKQSSDDVGAYINRVCIFHGLLVHGKVELTRVQRTNYNKAIA